MELEHPLMRVPFECLSREFRLAQKSLEKEMGSLTAELESLVASASEEGARSGAIEPAAAAARVDALVEALAGLKARMEAAAKSEARFADIVSARAAYLSELGEAEAGGAGEADEADAGGRDGANGDAGSSAHARNGTAAASSTTSAAAGRAAARRQREQLRQQHQEGRLGRFVAEHLLREGHTDLASRFIQETRSALGGLGFTDAEAPAFAQMHRVATALLAHDCEPALEWCADNASRLRRIESSLAFQLRRQQFIELVRAGRRSEAMAHAAEHLAPTAAASGDASASGGGGSGSGSGGGNGGAAKKHGSGAGSAGSGGGGGGGAAAAPAGSSSSSSTNTGGGGGGGLGPSSLPGAVGASGAGSVSPSPALAQLQQDMALLAFPDPVRCGIPQYERLFHETRWHELRALFLEDFSRALGVAPESPLLVSLHLGLCALKTHVCRPPSPGSAGGRSGGSGGSGFGARATSPGIGAAIGSRLGKFRRRGRSRSTSAGSESSTGGGGGGGDAPTGGMDATFTSSGGSSGGGGGGGDWDATAGSLFGAWGPGVGGGGGGGVAVPRPAPRQRSCPACHPYLAHLAAHVPGCRRSQSRLICRLSQTPMEGANYPMAMPNGSLYGMTALSQAAALSGGEVADPRTGERFHLRDLRRAYVL